MVWNGETALNFSKLDKEHKIIEITSCEELKLLADKVNAGEEYDGYEISLEKHLDMGARERKGSWDNEQNISVNWTSIGKTLENQLICKSINGKGNIIRGLYVKSTEKYAGIIGNTTAEVKNITIKDSYIEGATGTAGIVGTLRGGSINNCKNINTDVVLIEGDYQGVGGIVGQASDNLSIINCINSGNILGKGINTKHGYIDTGVGGILGLGMSNVEINNCENSGTIEGKGERTGGIVGSLNDDCIIQNCKNKGDIKSDEGNIGGIAGVNSDKIKINNCENIGKVEGKGNRVGGILGCFYINSIIENCKNKGNVIGIDGVGGILGSCRSNNQINYCENIGTIEGRRDVNGIVGDMGDNCIVTHSNNTGIIIEEQ